MVEAERCPVCGGRTFSASKAGPDPCSLECMSKQSSQQHREKVFAEIDALLNLSNAGGRPTKERN